MNSTIHSAHVKTPFSVVHGLEPALWQDCYGASECKVHAAAKIVTSQLCIQDLLVTNL